MSNQESNNKNTNDIQKINTNDIQIQKVQERKIFENQLSNATIGPDSDITSPPPDSGGNVKK